ncbi:hypothetical protein JK636_20870 [Clostridium sp. YIM B02515]|uniref:DUF6873 domain-containing protein n=1 Tax=Clostridium rhizosphaerae TaxID=2803861 RepID=A0ABS1TFZ4_9CLOT|nr:hypothetical protein [Clostridium rhizosphaerae]MBL4938171.1 hypothetical protein [Clostridium rhizosphaerae]
MKGVIVDYRIDTVEKFNLEKLGYEVIIVPPSRVLYEAVSGHPDMLLHIVNKDTIIIHKDMEAVFIKKLEAYNYSVLVSDNKLQNNYPFDIILNAVNLPKIFIHNIKYTDSKLLHFLKEKNLKNVKQGYSKCSTAIISNAAIITSDIGIAESAEEENIDVLLLPPGDILLPGLNYGFIGGCCGLLEDDLLAFYGSLDYYAYGKEVLGFLKKHNVKPVFLRNGKLIDRGSIFRIYNL